jgi:hypothetical protein
MIEIESFKQTSEKPYIRHDYKVVFANGKSAIFDNYEDVQRTWWQTPNQLLGHVEVLDHKETKPKPKPKSKGF